MKRYVRVCCVIAAALLASLLTLSPPAGADETAPLPLAGCDAMTLPDGDDATAAAPLGFDINTGDPGLDSTVYISENGLLTFDDAVPNWYNGFDLRDVASFFGDEELIAPLFADAIRQPGIGSVTYGSDTYGGRAAFCVEWNNMAPFVPEGYYDPLSIPNPLPTNSFQVVIVNRDDRAPGDFDVIVNYETIQWDDVHCPQGFFGEDRGDDFDFQVLRAPGEFDGCGCNFDFEQDFGCECDFEEQLEELCPPPIALRAGLADEEVEIAARAMAVNLVAPASPVFPFDNEGALAGVAFPQGFSGQVVSFPGSGDIFEMVDDDGLAALSNDSITPGRFIIEVRNGFMNVDLGGIVGNVNGADGAPIADVVVQACSVGELQQELAVDCVSTFTDADGNYEIVGVPVGDYQITANAPAGTDLYSEQIDHEVPGAFTSVAAQITLTGPTPVPDNVTFGPTSDWGVGTTINWNDDLDLSITGCFGGTATWTITAEDGPDRAGSLVEGPAGTYTTVIEPVFPSHGVSRLDISISCPDPADDQDTDFDLYIDPSGTVFESDSGLPVAGAVASLYRSDLSSGPFSLVPDGSVIMSPSNRTNPFTVGDNGRFGWDVISGYYVVEITADGCHAPDDVNEPIVRTDVLPVEPEWLGLELFIDCNNAPTIEDGGSVTLEAPATNGDLINPVTFDPDEEDVLTLTVDGPEDFPLGETIVNWTVRDPDGLTATTSTTVTVVDTTAPQVTIPDPITAEATGTDGATVDFSTSAVDSVDPDVPVVCVPPSGSTFALGATTVNCTATDDSNNAGVGSFEVNVVDTAAPTLALPDDIVAVAADGVATVVGYLVSATDTADAAPLVSCAPASGELFPIGTTTVNCTATDASGNSANGSFDVTVNDGSDSTPPEVTVPAGITTPATSDTGATVTFDASAVDAIDGPVGVTCTPASGSEFPIGATTVTCEAADAAGNVGTAGFVVTVTDLPPPVDGIRDTIDQIADSLNDIDGLSRRDARRARWALWYLDRADSDSYWENDNQLTDRRGSRAMWSLRGAVSQMSRINSAEVADLTAQLVDQMRTLAANRIAQAEYDGGHSYYIRRANQRLDWGDHRVASGYLSSAAWYFTTAWQWASWS